jgi:hypothetical protein
MIEPILEVVVEVVCGLTGYGVLKAVTFGRWSYAEGNDALPVAVGLLFWLLVIGAVVAGIMLL